MVAVTLDGLFDLVAVDGAPVELGSEVEVWGDEVGEGFEFAVVGAEVVVVGAVVGVVFGVVWGSFDADGVFVELDSCSAVVVVSGVVPVGVGDEEG